LALYKQFEEQQKKLNEAVAAKKELELKIRNCAKV